MAQRKNKKALYWSHGRGYVLTEPQLKATLFLTGKGWVSAYEIKRLCGVTRVTLSSLVGRGILGAKYGLGTVAFPDTIEYRLKESARI